MNTKIYSIRKIILAALIAIVSACALSLVWTSFATAASGQLTITPVEGVSDQSYKGIQIFVADVEGTQASNIAWASDDVKAAFNNVVGSDYTGTTAAQAAAYISENISNGDIIEDATFAGALAREYSKLSGEEFGPEEETSFDEGYVLVVSTSQIGTAPIFALIDDSQPAIITEKLSVPVAYKAVAVSSRDNFGKLVEAGAFDPIYYRIEGSLSGNYASFKTYKYWFTDTVDKGIEVLSSSVHAYVKSSGNELKFDVMQDGNVMKFGTDNLKELDPSITADDIIVVEYEARLTKDALGKANKGIVNEVELEYSSNPYLEDDSSTTTTKPDNTKVYAFGITLVKQGKGSTIKLPGAAFTVQNKETKKYAGKEGWQDAPYEWVSNEDGVVDLPVASGEFIITEVKAPTGYELLKDPIAAKLEAEFIERGDVQVLFSAQGDGVKDFAFDNSTGVGTITIEDEPTTPLKEKFVKTGDSTSLVSLVFASIVAAASIAYVQARKRKDALSEN
ncbi:MAG: isopeptide-forming domain-containing fimbrial protein [Eggerthellaceae bacterium]|nr:isopeptide-forming domain-containing fimbrial protein [Eggerthellaceae bacterium]